MAALTTMNNALATELRHHQQQLEEQERELRQLQEVPAPAPQQVNMLS